MRTLTESLSSFSQHELKAIGLHKQALMLGEYWKSPDYKRRRPQCLHLFVATVPYALQPSEFYSSSKTFFPNLSSWPIPHFKLIMHLSSEMHKQGSEIICMSYNCDIKRRAQICLQAHDEHPVFSSIVLVLEVNW